MAVGEERSGGLGCRVVMVEVEVLLNLHVHASAGCEGVVAFREPLAHDSEYIVLRKAGALPVVALSVEAVTRRNKLGDCVRPRRRASGLEQVLHHMLERDRNLPLRRLLIVEAHALSAKVVPNAQTTACRDCVGSRQPSP